MITSVHNSKMIEKKGEQEIRTKQEIRYTCGYNIVSSFVDITKQEIRTMISYVVIDIPDDGIPYRRGQRKPI